MVKKTSKAQSSSANIFNESNVIPYISTVCKIDLKKHRPLAVQDRGSGVTEEVLDKLGTPFITTKPNGTGLGLAVCYRIA